MSESHNRVAFVTGAASGIGRATVEQLLSLGWSVVGADLNAQAGAKMVDDLTNMGAGDRLESVVVDVAQEGDVEAGIATAVERFGSLDLVVNNAGVGGAFGRLVDIEVNDWDFTFSVLMRGVFLGTKHAARVMKQQLRGGAIVNIGSIAGLASGAGPQAYSSAKAAVLNFTRVAATELAQDRIRVNAVSPGLIATPIHTQAQAESHQALLGKLQPWPDAGRPQNIASVVVFLAGEEAAFITGENITVDGGVSASGSGIYQALGDPGERGISGLSMGNTGTSSVVRRPAG